MPIVWKTSFEDPLIKLIQSGQIGNSKKLVSYISTFYDASIKQGLPNPPGTPAGPLISGNTQLFKAALNAYFKLSAVKQQAISIKIYVQSIKSILERIKETASEIKKHSRDLKAALIFQQRIISKIGSLRGKGTPESDREIDRLYRTLVIYQEKEIFALREIQRIKDLIKDGIKPAIEKLKKKLIDLIKRILFAQMQDTKLKSTLALARNIKRLIQESSELRKEYIAEIKNDLQKIKEFNTKLRKITSSLEPGDAAQIRQAIRELVTSTSLNKIGTHGNRIIQVIDNIPDDKLPAGTKGYVRLIISKIIRLRYLISLKEEDIKNIIKQKLKDKIIKLISTFKPNFLPGLGKIMEIKRDLIEVRNIIVAIRTAIKEGVLMALIVSRLKRELQRIAASKLSKYEPSRILADLLNKLRTGFGDRYLRITDIQNAKSFIIRNLSIYLQQQKLIVEVINTLKSKYLVGIKKKISSKLFNPEEIIFNQFLQLALTGYWTLGTMPNLGLVTFPGIVTLPAELKSTSNVENFIRSLSKTFQAHALTIAGTYTTSTTPPVVLPWVGYF